MNYAERLLQDNKEITFHFRRIGYRKVSDGYQVIAILNSNGIYKHFKIFSNDEQAINLVKIITAQDRRKPFAEDNSDMTSIALKTKYWEYEDSDYLAPNEGEYLCHLNGHLPPDYVIKF